MRMTTAIAMALAGLPVLLAESNPRRELIGRNLAYMRGARSRAPAERPPLGKMAQHNRSNRRAKNKAARKSRKANRK